jgi:cold shock CspA family protein
MDEDGTDIFVHYDDLQKAGISKNMLKQQKNGQLLKLTFN